MEIKMTNTNKSSKRPVGRPRKTQTLNKKKALKARTQVRLGVPVTTVARENNYAPAELFRALNDLGVTLRKGRPNKTTGTLAVTASAPASIQA